MTENPFTLAAHPNPAFTEMASVLYNGRLVGYVDRENRVSLIVPRSSCEYHDFQNIAELVTRERGSCKSIRAAASVFTPGDDLEDDDSGPDSD